MHSDFKKILFAIPSLGSGGAERVICTLANAMADRGYDVGILLVGNSRVHYYLSQNVQQLSLECEARYGKSNAIARCVNRVKDIRRALVKSKPDVVISFMSENNVDVCFAAWGLKVPVIVSERNDPSIDPASRVKQMMRRLAYCRANGFVFQTPDAQAYFNRRIRKASCIIFNPITAQLPAAYEGAREKRIVSVGRLHKQKNFPLLIDAFEDFVGEHSDYVLEIYGEGALEEQLHQLVRSKGLEGKVVFKGFCKDVHEQIRSAAFFVMTSDFEGMPNALVEAMALGMPCISTDCRCGGPRLLIQNGENGLLIPTGQKDALLQAMKKLAIDSQYAQVLGKNAEKIKLQVDTETVVDQWLTYIKQCLD